MNKKGDAWALQVLVAFSIILAVAVVIFWYAIPALRGGEEGAKSFLEQQVEMLKKTGQSDVPLASFTEEEKKKLEKEAPGALTTLKLSSYKKDFDEAINVNDFDKAKKAIENYKAVCKDPKFYGYCSEVDGKYADVMLSKVITEENIYNENKARAEQKQTKLIGDLTPEEKEKYDLYKSKFKKIKEIYMLLKIGSSFEEPRSKFRELESEIRSNPANSGIKDKEIFKNLLAETFFWIIRTYLSEGRCDDNVVNAYFDLLKSDYSENIGVDAGNTPVLRGTYPTIMRCYDDLAYRQNKNVVENYNKILEFYSEYESKYPIVEYPTYYKHAVMNLGKVDCSKYTDLKVCHDFNRDIMIDVNGKEKIIKIKFTTFDISKNGALGCYWDVENIHECLNCAEYNIVSCSQYETEDENILDRELWATVCEANPCAVKDGPCVYDDGDGIFNLEDCCPNGQRKC